MTFPTSSAGLAWEDSRISSHLRRIKIRVPVMSSFLIQAVPSTDIFVISTVTMPSKKQMMMSEMPTGWFIRPPMRVLKLQFQDIQLRMFSEL